MPVIGPTLKIPFTVGPAEAEKGPVTPPGSETLTLTETARRLYEQLAPTYFREDETFSWPGQRFVIALATMFDPAATAVQPQNQLPPFAVLFDPLACPESWLPWLGQFVGIVPSAIEGLLQAKQVELAREWIASPINHTRGTAEAMQLAAQATLTGEKRLFFYPRYNGEAFRIKAVTYISETPSQSATIAALKSMMPAWCVLEYEAITGGTIATVEAAHATLAATEAADATVSELELHPEK